MSVNGEKYDVSDVEPRMLLSDFLRDRLGLTGTHVGCEHGVCGACTVLVNGDSVRSCLMLAVQTSGAEIVTVEGLGSPETLNELQAQFREHHGLAVRLLHARHADDRRGSAAQVPARDRRGDPGGALRESLPLHRIPEHRRRDQKRSSQAHGESVMKLNFLAAGRLRMKKSIYVPGADRSETIDLPVSSALIRHKQGNVLFDTGCHPSVVDNAEDRWGPLAKVMKPVMRADETLLPSLACIGLGPDDIDIVVNSHFHPTIAAATSSSRRQRSWLTQRRSKLRTRRAPRRLAILKAEWDYGQPIEAVSGERDLFGDSSVVLVPLPGHTPGTLGALVGLDRDGQFLLASDSVSLRQNLDADSAPQHVERRSAIEDLRGGAPDREGAAPPSSAATTTMQWQSLRKGAEGYE